MEKGIALYLGRNQKQLFRTTSHNSGNDICNISNDSKHMLRNSKTLSTTKLSRSSSGLGSISGNFNYSLRNSINSVNAVMGIICENYEDVFIEEQRTPDKENRSRILDIKETRNSDPIKKSTNKDPKPASIAMSNSDGKLDFVYILYIFSIHIIKLA